MTDVVNAPALYDDLDYFLNMPNQFEAAMTNSPHILHEQQHDLPALSPVDMFATTGTYDNVSQQDPSVSHSESSNGARFRVKTKQVFVCAYEDCNQEFGRKSELYRHHRSIHKKDRPFKCQVNGCYRSTHGFPRADKKNDHEWKSHGLRRPSQPHGNRN